jgi:hypothetical protein
MFFLLLAKKTYGLGQFPIYTIPEGENTQSKNNQPGSVSVINMNRDDFWGVHLNYLIFYLIEGTDKERTMIVLPTKVSDKYPWHRRSTN